MAIRYVVAILCSLFLCTYSFSQVYQVIGNVEDTTSMALPSATVVTMSKADSLLVGFGFTDDQGRFKIRDHAPGDYIIQVTFIGYIQHSQIISISDQDIDIGTIKLKTDLNKMDQITITGEHTPMVMQKDTLVYNAAAFQVQPNDVVEDLLRKMPGIEVEDDGTIKAQGEEVQQVLVDGKTFFGRDSRIATQNLPADAVDKVQVYDKKSDEAEFTGIDDGEREKTINLELKEDRKNGQFGKLSVGAGTDNRYDANLSMNRFNSKMKISGLGNFNNINEQRFASGSYSSVMGGLGGVGSRRAGSPLSSGEIKTNAGGLNVNYHPNSKLEIHGNYFLTHISTFLDQQTQTENFLSDRSFTALDTTLQNTGYTNHNVQFEVEYEIDTTQSIELNIATTLNRSDLILDNLTSITSRSRPENEGAIHNISNGDNISLSGVVRYKKKLGKYNDHSFNISLSGERDDVEAMDTIESEINYLTNATIEKLLQRKFDTNNQFDYSIRSAYAYPLSYQSFLEFKYNRKNYNTDRVINTFDIDNNEATLNEALSSLYTRDYYYDQGGIVYHFGSDKTQLSGGLYYQQSKLKGTNSIQNDVIQKTFVNVLPRFQLRHTAKNNMTIVMNYRTSINEPSISQLQPVINQSDPLIIYRGNPDLRPSYQHSIRLSYRRYDMFNFRSIYASGRLTYQQNPIINQTITDDFNISTTQPINVDNDITFFGSVGIGSPIPIFKTRINSSLSINYNKGILYLNEVKNTTQRYSPGINISIDNRNKDVIDVSIGTRYSYNLIQYSINKNQNQNFFNQVYSGRVRYNLSERITVGSDLDYRIYSQQLQGDNQSLPIWSAQVSYFVGKNKKGEFVLSAFDILNKNRGISQQSNLNYISYQEMNTIGRYVMLRFKYGFSPSQGNLQGSPRGGPSMRR